MKASAAAVTVFAAALALSACGDHGYDPPDREERVIEAAARYEESLFDTVGWDSRAERIRAGNLVYADECRRCHGALGRGDTEYARAQELDVPSLVRSDWHEGDSIEVVRRRVFTGHGDDMPTWGIGRLTPRQVDAAAYYLIEQLRQEVTDSTRIPGTNGD